MSKESPEYSELPPPPLNDVVKVLDSNQEKIESTKSLRARFEALHNDRPDDRPTSKSNRISVNNILRVQVRVYTLCFVSQY